MQRRAVVAVGLAVTLIACAPQPAPRLDLAAEEQAVRALSMRWLEMEKAKDTAGILALFTDDAIVFREDREPIVGHSAIQEYMAGESAANPQQVVEWSTDRVYVAASGDLATEFGTWSTSVGGPTGTDADSGRYITTYRKINGAWKVAADMSLSTKPEVPATTPSM